jgi:TRAP-type C4-dicarboxylate transport system permease small subunit
MAGLFRRSMDYLYLLCVIVGGTAFVLISAIIPWAVFTRYVLNSAASWPEPLAVLLTIVLTFIGAAAAYRLNLHMSISYFADRLPPRWRALLDIVVQLLMALIATFMIIWGERLVEVTWYNTIADFPFGRGHLSADPGRRRLPAAVHHRANFSRASARSGCPPDGNRAVRMIG